SYSGEWFNGQSHGFGVQTCADGSSYVRKFKFGLKHGLGSYHFRNGDKHAGEYFRDKIHGFGVCHFPNGHYYEGAWHEGRKQRYGTYGFITGFLQKRVCFVKRFRYVYIIPESIRFGCKGGDFRKLLIVILKTIYRGAQEMARKGVDQRRVDEQVVRAVAAANKALDSC
ncbi:hypothetical protein BRARA_G02137, partial [Brassica rapa]